MRQWKFSRAVLLLCLSSVISSITLAQGTAPNSDPWEGINRQIYGFNDTLDRYLLAPAARGYQWITPDAVETGIRNVFYNLLEINTIANDLLQFKVSQAGSDTGRFLINSTVGVVGIFDVATSLGLERHVEDFGQTLGYWGVSSGPYIMVPVLGPRTLRSGTGSLIDGQVDYVTKLDHVPTRNSGWSTRLISDRAALLKAEELISGDRYTFLREAYLSRREFLVNDGQVEDDFGDEDFEEEEWD